MSAFPFITFIAIPVCALAFFIVSLCLYISARRREKRLPGSVDAGTLAVRRTLLVISSVVFAVLMTVVISLFLLIISAIAYM